MAQPNARPLSPYLSTVCVAGLLLLSLGARSACAADEPLFLARADIPARMGCGSFFMGRDWEAKDRVGYEILKTIGFGMARLEIYPNAYYDRKTQRATPENLDRAVLLAHEKGIRPIAYFHYFAAYLPDDNIPLGSEEQWRAIGDAFARRFAPNSQWLVAQGIRNWGIEVYQAINEPDLMERRSKKTGEACEVDAREYHDALKGLARGVKGVDRRLRAFPGGFAFFDKAIELGYLGAIADLLQDGTLDGVDIHVYLGYWKPVEKFATSSQGQYDTIRKYLSEKHGVTRVFSFCTTEFGIHTAKENQYMIDDATAAQLLLTHLVNTWGVCSHEKPITVFALPWNVFAGKGFGVGNVGNDYCESLQPYRPNAKGAMLVRWATWMQGMRPIAAAPYSTGIYEFRGPQRTIFAWQNLKQYSNRYGSSFVVERVPPGAKECVVRNYLGEIQRVATHGQRQLTIGGLEKDQTYLFEFSTP